MISTRFQDVYDLSLKIVQAFVEKVGNVLQEKQLGDLLLVVSELKVRKPAYSAWGDCIGAFLKVMGAEVFLNKLPLQLSEFDMNSLTYAQDSRSYLVPIIKHNLQKGDLAYFVQNIMPQIQKLDDRRVASSKPGQHYSLVKAKKYETLIV